MSDIVERLKEPDIHYPGNFDTPKRANAMLSCLCQEAAEEIEALRQKLSEWRSVFGHLGKADECGNEWNALISERDALRREVDRLMKYSQDALDAVRNELVAIGLLPAERGWLAHEGRKDDLTLEAELMFMRESGYLHLLATREELAASQAREQKFRELLSNCFVQFANAPMVKIAKWRVEEAFSITADTTALQAMIAKAGEVMLERAESMLRYQGSHNNDLLRALPAITIDDLK